MNRFSELRAGLQPYPGCRLVQVLGRGGFAEVWEAEKNGQRIALKFLPTGVSLAAAKEIGAIQALRRLEHPHLIHIDRVWCHEGFVVIGMELADGSLLDLFNASLEENGEALPHDLVLDYLTQAAHAIDFLNARQHRVGTQRVGFQHCDIKPSNLLLCGDTIKLSDFGLAAPTSAALRPHRRAGTLDFVAPEVFQGRLSNWTDQYALAVTYCLLRGGRLPFGISPRHFDQSYIRPDPDLTMLPREERPILAGALTPVPQDRWPCCREMMAHLAALMQTPALECGIPPMADNVVENPQLLEGEMEI